jgi:hypothetical protein
MVNHIRKGILYLLATNEQSKTDKTGGGCGGGTIKDENMWFQIISFIY